MSIYRGHQGINREVTQQLRGYLGVNREIQEQYRGVAGVNRLVFSSGIACSYQLLYPNDSTSFATLASDKAYVRLGYTMERTGSWGRLDITPKQPIAVVSGDLKLNNYQFEWYTRPSAKAVLWVRIYNADNAISHYRKVYDSNYALTSINDSYVIPYSGTIKKLDIIVEQDYYNSAGDINSAYITLPNKCITIKDKAFNYKNGLWL